MTTRISCGMTLVIALGALAACSQGASTPTGSIAAANNSALAKAGNACDRKLLTADDMTGILSEPITGTKPLDGDAQTCYFVTAATGTQGGAEIMISMRPGLGEATLATYTSGKMDAYAKSTPLAGVGDSAVWMSETFEVNAQKNNLLCVAGLGGSATGFLPRTEDMKRRKWKPIPTTKDNHHEVRISWPSAPACHRPSLRADVCRAGIRRWHL